MKVLPAKTLALCGMLALNAATVFGQAPAQPSVGAVPVTAVPPGAATMFAAPIPGRGPGLAPNGAAPNGAAPIPVAMPPGGVVRTQALQPALPPQMPPQFAPAMVPQMVPQMAAPQYAPQYMTQFAPNGLPPHGAHPALPVPSYMPTGYPALPVGYASPPGHAPNYAMPAAYAPPAGYAQAMPPNAMPPNAIPPSMMPHGAMPPGMMPPGAVMPAQYAEPTMGGEMMMGPGMAEGMMLGEMPPEMYGDMGEDGICPYCGGRGCDYCLADSLANSSVLRLLRLVKPYSEGPNGCTQRWFDLSLEATAFHRNKVAEKVTNFTSAGTLIPPVIVLSTNDLAFEDDYEFGMRVTAALQLWAGSNIEFTYMGLNEWSASAAVDSLRVAAPGPNQGFDLYHVFSNFGQAPPASIDNNGTPGDLSDDSVVLAGFVDTDAASRHTISYTSRFDSFELTYRNRWVGSNCRIQGSYHVGPRYFYLVENFRHTTQVNVPTLLPPNPNPLNALGRLGRQGSMLYNVDTVNSLTGAQLGLDFWVSMLPGISVGIEGKAGAYLGRERQRTFIHATSVPVFINEERDRTRLSGLGEAGALALVRLNQRWAVRAGYHVLLVEGVALAVDNFNPVPPPAFNPPAGTVRNVGLDTSGTLFLHGGTLAVEYQW